MADAAIETVSSSHESVSARARLRVCMCATPNSDHVNRCPRSFSVDSVKISVSNRIGYFNNKIQIEGIKCGSKHKYTHMLKNHIGKMSDMKLEQKRIKLKLDCGYVYNSLFFRVHDDRFNFSIIVAW